MRHSPRLAQTGDARIKFVGRRYLKREHIRFNDQNRKEPVSLKEFARMALEADGESLVMPKVGVAKDSMLPSEHKAGRLKSAAEFWLKNKATKQVRTVHPKRVKHKKAEKLNVPKADDKKKRR